MIRLWKILTQEYGFVSLKILTKAILESITRLRCDLKELNQVQVHLQEAIARRKFLIVLDDIWSKNYGLWKTLMSPFVAGARGSKIIMTTRSTDVALTIGPIEYYSLKLLSDNDCWSVFVKHAFEGRDIDAHHNLELIREKVIRKCRGLPLAAATLGGLLRCNQRDDEWDDILNNKIWNLSEEGDILPVLSISSEFYGKGCLKPFQSLETLYLGYLGNWEHWDSMEENELVERFPCLSDLSIRSCTKLSGRLSANLPSLKKLSVNACPMLVVSFSSLPLLYASQCESIVWCSSTDSKLMKSMSLSYISKFGDWFMQGFQNVECLKIVRCEELLYMWQNEILLEKPQHVLHNLASLRELCISNCPSLVSIPEACFISTLGEQKISNYKALTCIVGCDSLRE